LQDNPQQLVAKTAKLLKAPIVRKEESVQKNSCCIFVLFNFRCWACWQKIEMYSVCHLVPSSSSKHLCCSSYTMLTGIPVSFRWQKRPGLVRTVLTSSHILSCLLHLLIASGIALADCDPLASGRTWCRKLSHLHCLHIAVS